MSGVMPPTALLLVNDLVVVGHFDNYTQIGHHFGISISDVGKITFNGKEQNPTYVLAQHRHQQNAYTPSSAIADWCRCYMEKNLPYGHRIYRYLL